MSNDRIPYIGDDSSGMSARQKDLAYRPKLENCHNGVSQGPAIATLVGKDWSRSRSNTPSVESVFDHASTYGSGTTISSSMELEQAELHADQDDRGFCGHDVPDFNSQSSEHGEPSENYLKDPAQGSDALAATDPTGKVEDLFYDAVDASNELSLDDPDTMDTESEDEVEFDSESEMEEVEDDWSGQPGRIEAAVLSNVENLDDAAWLIMELHNSFVQHVEQKIGGWQQGVIQYQGTDGSSNHDQRSQTGGSGGDQNAGSSSRKRRRTSGSRDRKSSDGHDDNDDRDYPPSQNDGPSPRSEMKMQFACPFHKKEPARFCSNSSTGILYRTCPDGSSTIQRVKEHLQRKHIVVQCERCFKIFSGKNKDLKQRKEELTLHLRQKESCTAEDNDELRQGIGVDQWALLNSGGGKRKKLSEVEKWFEIWDICFPGRPRPPNPWVQDDRVRLPRAANDDFQSFPNLLNQQLRRDVASGKLRFPAGQEQAMLDWVKQRAETLFSVHTYIHGTPGLTDSSSSNTQPALPHTPGPIQGFGIGPAGHLSPQPEPPKGPTLPGQASVMLDNNATSAMGFGHQGPFGIMPPQIPVTLAYQQTLPYYLGGHGTAVPPPTPMTDAAQRLAMGPSHCQQGFGWNLADNMDMSLGYLQSNSPGDPEIDYPQNNNQGV